MKRTLLTIRDLILFGILSLLPLVIGMALCMVLTGSFDFAMRYLDMPLLGTGVLISYLAFKKNGLDMPKERKAPVKLGVWFIALGMCSTFLIMAIAMSELDTAPSMNVSKQMIAIFLAPVVEELQCRYLMTNIIKRGDNSRKLCIIAAAVTTVLWAAPHCLTNPVLIIRLLLTGLITSAVYQTTGSIKICIFEHAASNTAVTIAYIAGLKLGHPAVIALFAVLSAVSAVFFVKELAGEIRYIGHAHDVELIPVTE